MVNNIALAKPFKILDLAKNQLQLAISRFPDDFLLRKSSIWHYSITSQNKHHPSDINIKLLNLKSKLPAKKIANIVYILTRNKTTQQF